METYSLETRPSEQAVEYRKTGTVRLYAMSDPFKVETQEGVMTISRDTVKDWPEDEPYYLAYPCDGSMPYSIAPKFVKDNYVPVK